MSTCDFTYIAHDGVIPERLPTLEEIESATEIINNIAGCKVVGIGEHFVVKFGVHVDLLEGDTILFLKQSTTVPVPRVYALFRSPDERKKYIIMERIRGSTLLSAWPNMNQASKETVSSKLRLILEDMRKLKTPGGYCSAGHRGLPDGLFWTNNPSDPFSGPFNTEADLNSAIIAKYVEEGMPKHKADYYVRTFREIFQGHVPIFTHGDLQRKNIMVRDYPSTGEIEASTNIQIVLIDWETSGWYPSYWEYAMAIYACGRWDDDWNFWIDQMLEPYRNGYSWMGHLLREMWS